MNELIDTRHFMNIFQIISDSCVIKRERVARLKKKKKRQWYHRYWFILVRKTINNYLVYVSLALF